MQERAHDRYRAPSIGVSGDRSMKRFSRLRRGLISVMLATTVLVSTLSIGSAAAPAAPTWWSGPAAHDPQQAALEAQLAQIFGQREAIAKRGCVDVIALTDAAIKLRDELQQSYSTMSTEYYNLNFSEVTSLFLVTTLAGRAVVSLGELVVSAPAAFGLLGAAALNSALAIGLTAFTTATNIAASVEDDLETGAGSALTTLHNTKTDPKFLNAIAGSAKLAQWLHFVALVDDAYNLITSVTTAYNNANADTVAYMTAGTQYANLIPQLAAAVAAAKAAADKCPPASPSPGAPLETSRHS